MCLPSMMGAHTHSRNNANKTQPKRHSCDHPYPRETYAQQKHCILHIESVNHAIPRLVIRISGYSGLEQARASPQPFASRQISRAPPKRWKCLKKAYSLFPNFPSKPCSLVRLNTHTTKALHKTKADKSCDPVSPANDSP